MAKRVSNSVYVLRTKTWFIKLAELAEVTLGLLITAATCAIGPSQHSSIDTTVCLKIKYRHLNAYKSTTMS